MNKSDNELIDAYLNGDESAIDIIINRYQNFIYNIAIRMTSNFSDAEDITQEVFITLIRKINQFEKNSQFSTWLYRIAINTCYDFLKRRKRAPLSLEDKNSQLINNKLIATSSKDLETKETQEIVQNALNKLPEKLRSAIILYDIKELKYEEIADALGISMSAVKSRINRARKKIYRILKQYWEQNE